VLWDLHVAAVAADNPGLEVCPPLWSMTQEQQAAIASHQPCLVEFFVHLRILPMLCIPIGELFDLDRLAADCADDGVWEALLTFTPLNLRAGFACRRTRSP
jgi:hypothetical protein